MLLALVLKAVLNQPQPNADTCEVPNCKVGNCFVFFCTQCDTEFLPNHIGNASMCFSWNSSDKARVPNCDQASANHTCSSCDAGFLPNRLGAPTECINYTGGIRFCAQASSPTNCTRCFADFLPDNLTDIFHCTYSEVENCATADPDGKCTSCTWKYFFVSRTMCSTVSGGGVAGIVITIFCVCLAAILAYVFVQRKITSRKGFMQPQRGTEHIIDGSRPAETASEMFKGTM